MIDYASSGPFFSSTGAIRQRMVSGLLLLGLLGAGCGAEEPDAIGNPDNDVTDTEFVGAIPESVSPVHELPGVFNEVDDSSMIWEGDLKITTDTAINDFCAHYTAIHGNLQIMDTKLKSLVGLSCLTELRGNLMISDNPVLASIEGLAQLDSIYGHLTIDNNAVLEDLSGLDAVSIVGSGIMIRDNAQLTSLSGLEGMGQIGFLFVDSQVEDEASVTPDFPGPHFDGIKIEGNDQLVDIQALSGLGNIAGSLVIEGNAMLEDVEGFTGVRNVSRDVIVENNASIMDLEGLYGIESIGQDLVITDNANLDLLEAEALLDEIGTTNIGGVITIDN